MRDDARDGERNDHRAEQADQRHSVKCGQVEAIMQGQQEFGPGIFFRRRDLALRINMDGLGIGGDGGARQICSRQVDVQMRGGRPVALAFEHVLDRALNGCRFDLRHLGRVELLEPLPLLVQHDSRTRDANKVEQRAAHQPQRGVRGDRLAHGVLGESEAHTVVPWNMRKGAASAAMPSTQAN